MNALGLLEVMKPALLKAAEFVKTKKDNDGNVINNSTKEVARLEKFETMLKEFKEAREANDAAARLSGKKSTSNQGNQPWSTMHTENIGAGAELVEDVRYSNKLIEKICGESELLRWLPWNHGDNLALSQIVPIIGDYGYFECIDERQDNVKTYGDLPVMHKATGEVCINQKTFAAACPISKKLINYSLIDLMSYVLRHITRSANRTIESYIINADPDTDDTNINCKGLDLEADGENLNVHRLGGACGIRYHGLKGCKDKKTGQPKPDTTNCFTIGAYTDGDFLKAKAMLGCNGANKKDLLFIMSNMSECSSLALPCIKCRDTAGLDASFFTGEINQAYGIPMYASPEYPDFTDIDGCINSDNGMNQYGSFALIKRSSIQYGFGQTVEVKTVDFPARWVCIVACFDFGFVICDCQVQKDPRDRAIVVGKGGEVIGYEKPAAEAPAKKAPSGAAKSAKADKAEDASADATAEAPAKKTTKKGWAKKA